MTLVSCCGPSLPPVARCFLKCHPEGPRTNCDPLQFVLGTVGEKLQKRKFSSVRDLFWGHKAGLCFVFDWFCFVGDRSLLSLRLEATFGEYHQPLVSIANPWSFACLTFLHLLLPCVLGPSPVLSFLLMLLEILPSASDSLFPQRAYPSQVSE